MYKITPIKMLVDVHKEIKLISVRKNITIGEVIKEMLETYKEVTNEHISASEK